MVSLLEKTKEHTMVVADTGDFEAIKKYGTMDATTNPTLIMQASLMPKYEHIFAKSIEYAKSSGVTGEDLVDLCIDHLAVSFGCEILKIVPGRVSTEIDPRYSYDKDVTVKRALRIIDMYKANGFSKERVLIKISSTWEGIQAGKTLEEQHGIHCNLTLLFSMCQAIACAEAKVTLISPFVGRITDWYTAKTGKKYEAAEEPGILNVIEIYDYFKKFDYKTTVMAASLRTVGHVKAICGLDAITIAPKLLDELSNLEGELPVKLTPELAKSKNIEQIKMTEANFRWLLSDDAMATEKLTDGIRLFTSDAEKLKAVIRTKLQ